MAVYVVEGFDMVGKTKTILDIEESELQYNPMIIKYGSSTVYRPDYEFFDSALKSRNDSYIIGASVTDFIRSLGQEFLDNNLVIFDRQLPSSVVYDELYSSGTNISPYLRDMYLDMNRSIGVSYVYVRHSDKESAKRIYEYTVSKRENDGTLEDLDKFDDFNDYWRTYEEFDKAYKKFFLDNNLRSFVVLVTTYSNEDGSLVSLATNPEGDWL